MYSTIEAFQSALRLIFQFDPELLRIIGLSLSVSGVALMIAAVAGIPLGTLLGLTSFRGRRLLISLANTLMGLPPVVAGLFLYLFLSRSGPFGFLNLLYTPSAMILAQTLLALPIIIALCHTAVVRVPPVIRQAAASLGATPYQTSLVVIREARYGIVSALVAGFGRVMAEVGAILIVGGNIAGYTRVMTTAIALETDKGNFRQALALGIVLLIISLLVNIGLHLVQQKGEIPLKR